LGYGEIDLIDVIRFKYDPNVLHGILFPTRQQPQQPSRKRRRIDSTSEAQAMDVDVDRDVGPEAEALAQPGRVVESVDQIWEIVLETPTERFLISPCLSMKSALEVMLAMMMMLRRTDILRGGIIFLGSLKGLSYLPSSLEKTKPATANR